jgi:hypothetical protein
MSKTVLYFVAILLCFAFRLFIGGFFNGWLLIDERLDENIEIG